jgi:hypothetical protein
MNKSVYIVFLLNIYYSYGNNNKCSNIKLQTNPPINLTEYIHSSWYIQQQQLTSYQRVDDLYCVVATYNKDNYSKVPFFSGNIISVYNYANSGSVNGNITNNSTILCARQPNNNYPEKLLVAPCFLPNILGGPYWILAAGPYSYNYNWAIVIGGQPNNYVGNNTCTTSEDKINNSGLWLFSRKQVLDEQSLNEMYNILEKQNISTQLLRNVTQYGCNYTNAFIKH